ncbi:MAG: hypothetical protein ACXVFN_12970 [Solirubrobacteraceae bacterium]
MATLRRLRQRLTYANVTATAALFVALGGSSYAAVTLPRNSVGAAQLRKSSVRSDKVRDRSLEVRDLSLRARESLRGQRGPVGPQGPPGGTGSSGSSSGGTSGIGLVYRTATGSVPFGTSNSTTVSCDPGQHVTGGGLRVDTAGSDAAARESYPSSGNTAWTARVGNDDLSAGATYTVIAICASG